MSTQPFSLPRRLRAGRILAGYNNSQDFARAIGAPGFNNTNIRHWERGDFDPSSADIVVIAAKCGLPIEFFDPDVSFDRMTGAAPPAGVLEQLQELQEQSQKTWARLSELEAQLRSSAGGGPSPGQPPARQR